MAQQEKKKWSFIVHSMPPKCQFLFHSISNRFFFHTHPNCIECSCEKWIWKVFDWSAFYNLWAAYSSLLIAFVILNLMTNNLILKKILRSSWIVLSRSSNCLYNTPYLPIKKHHKFPPKSCHQNSTKRKLLIIIIQTCHQSNL